MAMIVDRQQTNMRQPLRAVAVAITLRPSLVCH